MKNTVYEGGIMKTQYRRDELWKTKSLKLNNSSRVILNSILWRADTSL